MVAFIAVALALAVQMSAFEAYADFSASYEQYELDEIVSLLAILPIALLAYIWRRHRDLSSEMAAYALLQDELRFNAEHDGLTGLPNRRLFVQRLTAALAPPQAADGMTAVLLLDLDHFKEINDTLGHHIGDELLGEVGERLRCAVRPQDTVARMGGNEFAVLLTGLVGAEEAEDIAKRLQEAFAAPVQLPDMSLPVEASLGIALAPEDGTDADLLLQRADIAMYQAKGQHTRTARYLAASDTSGPERLVLLSELRVALDLDELVLHYQPKVEFVDRSRAGR